MSQFHLPFKPIGSWTNLYNFYLQHSDHEIDHIISPTLNAGDKLSNVSYHYVDDNKAILHNVLQKVKLKSSFSKYINVLDDLIQENQKYVIKIIDNSGLALNVHNYLVKKGIRNLFHIMYSFHGFAPSVSNKKATEFLYAVDEIIFLTHLSYLEWKKEFNELPFKARVLHNSCDGSIFKTIDHFKK